VTLEGGNDLFGIAAAKRHHVDRRKSQVCSNLNFRDRDHASFDHRIMHVTAGEHICQRVPHQFADTQLSL
jgi:hypothetical protein